MKLLSTVVLAGLAVLSSAYHAPRNQPTWGALTAPNLQHSPRKGQTFRVTWDTTQATADHTVSLVLCRGPSTNCVNDPNTLPIGGNGDQARGIASSKGYFDWHVPCAGTLPAGTANTKSGYGMLIIVDQTGEFQYSTQFSILANRPVCCPNCK